MARKMKNLYECSFKQLYTYRNMYYQEILEGSIEFPWALFMLLDHPKFIKEPEKQRRMDLKKIFNQMDSKYLNSIFIDVNELEVIE